MHSCLSFSVELNYIIYVYTVFEGPLSGYHTFALLYKPNAASLKQTI